MANVSGREWLLYTLIGLLFMLIFAFVVFQPITVLPRIALAPGYVLTDPEGYRLTSEDLRGSITLYAFTDASCSGSCSRAQQTMQSVAQWAPERTNGVGDVNFVTIALDGEQGARRQRLQIAAAGIDRAEYAQREHVLFGDAALVKEIVGNVFNTYYRRTDDGVMEYDAALILVDSWGIQRAEYRTPGEALETIQRDIGYLDREARNNHGIYRLGYEAAHLFLCYP